MAETVFTSDMFPDEETGRRKSDIYREAIYSEGRWKNFYEFIAFCIGKHSSVTIYAHVTNLNFIQDLIVYLLVGTPLCYVQLLLGQYTQTGIFMIRRMLPIAQGITYTYLITIFTLTIIIVTEMETNMIYLVLAMAPSEAVWNICPPDFAESCWNYSSECTVGNPCLDGERKLPSYLFWNESYMGGAYSIKNARIGIPDYRRIFTTIISWMLIYFLTIMTFGVVKKAIQILVACSVIAKVLFFIQYGSSLGFLAVISKLMYIKGYSWFAREAWLSSILRVISSMMLGDFNYIMYGVYATYSAKTGSLTFLGAMSGYCILLLETVLLKGAVLAITTYSKLDTEDEYLIFYEHAPVSLIIFPASLCLLKKNQLWVIFFFFTNIITSLAWCVINITFIQQSLYQRFEGMKSYYKYVCPAFCILGFVIGVFVQTKEIYEIRYDLTMLIDEFCQHLNLIFLTVIVAYIYGFKRLGDDIQFMTGKQPAAFWKFTWVISPIVMTFTVPIEFFDRSHRFFFLRMLTILIVFSPVLIFAVLDTAQKLYRRDILGLFKSDPLWGPNNEHHRQQRNTFHPRKQSKYKSYNVKCPHHCLLRNPGFTEVIRDEKHYDQFVLGLFEPTDQFK